MLSIHENSTYAENILSQITVHYINADRLTFSQMKTMTADAKKIKIKWK